MQSIIDFIMNMNFSEWVVAINGFIAASYALALLIPGEQPDKFLEKFLNLTKKISKK